MARHLLLGRRMNRNESKEPKDILLDLLNEMHTGMLVTVDAHGFPRARPLVLAQVDDDGSLSFVMDRHSTALDELNGDQRVGVVFEGRMRFVSVSGVAKVSMDKNELQEVWTPALRPWFPEGYTDDRALLVKVKADHAEYWDHSGIVKGVEFVTQAAKAVAEGQPMETPSPKTHGQVDFRAA